MSKYSERRFLRVSAFAKASSLLAILLFLHSCKTEKTTENYSLTKATASQTTIDESLGSVDSIEQFIAPYKKNLSAQMDSVLSYNPKLMHKNDYELNTPIGNFFAETVRVQADPVFKSRTGKSFDMALLNHGGIRAALPQGQITMRNAYEIMPFENQIVVAELDGSQMNRLVNYLVERERAHPFEGLKIALDKNGKLKSALIKGEPINSQHTYYVATTDYLFNGGDNMSFFEGAKMTDLDYKLRNAIIDYLRKTDTLNFEHDDRFTKSTL
ncbi:hypothetical protein BST97_07365 [Nonlabens spongiae]|uniref:5'-Nucleotidase C-terminal domain-containing protein n=1 Tax=Nonlabens spongiae TaxID=331648 RepID=A0A1W6MJP4_9FLAO|nr:5'-nucleotidase [Nonlabens spongiae]ARN77834.1 hypothetical protein BST97_07365 [Nonlabens spongiae]